MYNEKTTRLVNLFAGLILGLGIVAPASASERTLKFGHVGEPGSLFDVSANEFANRVNAELAGKVKIEVFGASRLGTDKELLRKLKRGTVDFSLPSTVMSSVVDLFGVFEMPYLLKDRDHMARVENEIFWSRLAPLLEPEGYKVIAVWENGFRHITNNKRPIKVPADLDGINMRTPQGKWRAKVFQSYGASTTPMAFSEVFTALKTGVTDGQENPFTQIHSAKFQEVQKYLSLTGHIYTPAYLTVGKEKWERLPENIRGEIERIAWGTQVFVYETAVNMEKDLLDKLKASGMKVNEPNKKAFVKASAPIYLQFGTEVEGGLDIIDHALSLAE